jgi:glycosyltransferase involved in cell wall biosynthesis
VLENPEDSDRMAEAARDRFLQHYGLDAHLKKMESLYRALVPGYVRRS